MYRRLLLSLCLFALGSCAYALDGGTQDVTFVTPGAHNALCYAWVDDIKYKIRPPTTTNIVKSKNDMRVDCKAPGNRHREVVIASRISNSTNWNVVNGLAPGAAWDAFSGAAYQYPDRVEIDFTNLKTKPQELPAQNAPDILQPEDYMLEEFLPGDPALNSDKFKSPTQAPQRREESQSAGYTDEGDAYMTGEGGEETYGKSNLESVPRPPADMNPAAAPPAPVIGPAVNEQPVFPVE